MARTSWLDGGAALARRSLAAAAITLCWVAAQGVAAQGVGAQGVAAQAEDVDPNGVAVAFNGGDTSGAPGVVNGVVLHVEITDQQVALSHGFRSMSLLADIDCQAGRERRRKATAFGLPNLAGPALPHNASAEASGEWATPEPYMGEVIKTVCSMHGLRAAELQAPSETLASAPAPEPAALASVEPAAVSPTEAAVPSGSEAAAAPTPPIGASPSLPTHAYPVPDASPASPAAMAGAPPPHMAGPRSGALGQARVQIASSQSRADAQAELGRSAALIQAPLRGEIEVATVHGRTVYRSIIAPFESESDARAFCAHTGLTLEGCFVWAR
jgi:hypothetical protein